MTAVCTVRVLGGFLVAVDGRSVPDDAWRHRRGADLVKLLALAPRHRLHREQVMEALWPDMASDAAGANLRKAVHYARRALGSEAAVATEGSMLQLWPQGRLSVDLDRFEEAATSAISAEDPAIPTAAVSLYRGELLPEDPYATWASTPRDRARLSYLRLLRRAGMWERVIDVDPADEQAHRELMRAELEAGNRQAAIRQFERLRDALREELGVSPDAASVELYEKVLAMEGHEPPTPQERARGLLARGLVHWNRRHLDLAERNAQEARTLAIEAGLGRELGEASALLGLVAHAQGRWRDLFRIEFQDSVGRAPELASFVLDAHLCFAEFSLYDPAGHEDVVPFANELLSVAEEAGSIHGRAVATLMLGEAALLSGRLDEAERQLKRAADLNEDAGHVSGQSLATARLAESAIARAQRSRAIKLLSKARRLAERSTLVSHLLVRVLGAMVQAAADPKRALEVVKDAEVALARREVCEPCSMPFRVAATTASARAGDRDRAAKYLEDAERLAGMWQGGPWLAAVWEARGELRRAEGEEDQAAALFREAAEGFARVGRTLDEARCRVAADALR
ncbi:MAG: BTAD domain-containing putative transcriptional regulator [Actinomycetota bacterium]